VQQLSQDEYLGTRISFSVPLNEPALLAPDSVRWRVYKNGIALGIGGVAAVLLEFAEPRIRSGVWDHSTYKDDPIGRSKRTGLVAMLSCYGPASAAKAVIGQVNHLHGKVKGDTPDGTKYRALDPVLLDWVAATASYGFVTAYDRFVQPLGADEMDRFMREGEAVGRQFGARHGPPSVAAFHEMMAKLEPSFEPHPIILEFLDIIQSGRAAPEVPRFLHRAIGRAAVSLLPPHIRARLQLGRKYDLTIMDKVVLRLAGKATEKKIDRQSPPCLASERLGLPYNFLYLPQNKQKELLRAREQKLLENSVAA
jgi:uncharacterized protein (DUF2236 family)